MNRLDELKKLLEAEKKGDNDPRYIEDLELSIERLQNVAPFKMIGE